jgi:hypothetical protein
MNHDSRSSEEFIRQGYSVFELKMPGAEPARQATAHDNECRIDDDDILSNLRNGFQRAQEQQRDTEPRRWEDNSERPFFYNDEEESSRQPRTAERDAGGDSFFEPYNTQTNREETRENQTRGTFIPPQPIPNRPRGIDFDFSAIGDILGMIIRAIPWRLLFTVMILGVLAGGIMTIWNMRYAILNSVLGFAIELLPIVLLIGGIVYLLRAMFR